MLTPVGQAGSEVDMEATSPPEPEAAGQGRCTHTRLAPVYVGVGHTEEAQLHKGCGPLRPLAQGAGHAAWSAGPAAPLVCRGGPSGVAPLLLFFRKEGVRNFSSFGLTA